MEIESAFESFDSRVSAINVSFQMSVSDYIELANIILFKNLYQRKRIRKKDRTYEILRDDLLRGCIMPAISLATTESFGENNLDPIKEITKLLKTGKSAIQHIKTLTIEAIESREIIILDGIQRTYAIESAIEIANQRQMKSLKSLMIRFELYIGLTQTGILYRMLTLNTGQTPMTLRHQLEIVFSNYLNRESMPRDIMIIREVDRRRIDKIGKYKFSDVIGLYHSYLTNNPASMDKSAVLEQLAQLEFIENYKPDVDENLSLLLTIYHDFVNSLNDSNPDWRLDESLDLDRPFGKTILRAFSRSQTMAGFGSATKSLILKGEFPSLIGLRKHLTTLNLGQNDVSKGMTELNISMNKITQKGYYSKIGDFQRAFLKQFFTLVLKEWAKGTINLQQCAMEALRLSSKPNKEDI